MNKKLRCFLILIVVSLLIVSCVEGEATETPATESPEPSTEVLMATELPTIQSPATEAPTNSNCSVTPDGDGQAFGETINLNYSRKATWNLCI